MATRKARRARAHSVPNSYQNPPTSADALQRQNPPFQRVLLMANVLQEYLF